MVILSGKPSPMIVSFFFSEPSEKSGYLFSIFFSRRLNAKPKNVYNYDEIDILLKKGKPKEQTQYFFV